MIFQTQQRACNTSTRRKEVSVYHVIYVVATHTHTHIGCFAPFCLKCQVNRVNVGRAADGFSVLRRQRKCIANASRVQAVDGRNYTRASRRLIYDSAIAQCVHERRVRRWNDKRYPKLWTSQIKLRRHAYSRPLFFASFARHKFARHRVNKQFTRPVALDVGRRAIPSMYYP